MSDKPQPWQDEEVLRRLYIERGLTMREVAEFLGISAPTINKWIQRYNLSKPGTAYNKYSDEELLEWIESFVVAFGVVPSPEDFQPSDFPGPGPQTYLTRFGSWRNAIQEAGYEPRGNNG